MRKPSSISVRNAEREFEKKYCSYEDIQISRDPDEISNNNNNRSSHNSNSINNNTNNNNDNNSEATSAAGGGGGGGGGISEAPQIPEVLYYPPTEMMAALLPNHQIPFICESLGDGLEIEDFIEFIYNDVLVPEYSNIHFYEQQCRKQLHALFKEIDFNDNGEVDWGEYSTHLLVNLRGAPTNNPSRAMEKSLLQVDRDSGFDPPPPAKKMSVFQLNTQALHAIRFQRSGPPPATFSPAWGCHIVAQERGIEFGVAAEVELTGYRLANTPTPSSHPLAMSHLMTNAEKGQLHQKLELVALSVLKHRICSLEPLCEAAYPPGASLRRPWLAATTSDDRLLYIELADDPLTLMTKGHGELKVVKNQYLPGKHSILRWNPQAGFLAAVDTRGKVRLLDPTDDLSALPKERLSFYAGGSGASGGGFLGGNVSSSSAAFSSPHNNNFGGRNNFSLSNNNNNNNDDSFGSSNVNGGGGGGGIHQQQQQKGTVSDLVTMPELAACDKIICATSDNIRMFDTARGGEFIHTLGDHIYASKLAYSAGTSLVAACVADESDILLFSPHSAGRSSFVRSLHDPMMGTGSLRGFPKQVIALEGTPYLTSFDSAGVVRLWDLRSSTPVCTFRSTGEDASRYVETCETVPLCTTRAISVDPKRLELAAVSRTIDGSRLDTFRMKLTDARDPLDAHDADLLCVEYIPDMRQLASLATDDTLHFWDGKNMVLRRRIKEFVNSEGETAAIPGKTRRPVTACSIDLPAGRKCFIGLASGEVFCYSTVTRCEIAEFPAHEGQVVQILVNLPDRVVSGGADGVIYINSLSEELDYRNFATIRLNCACQYLAADPTCQLIFALDARCRFYEIDADPDGAYFVLSTSNAVHCASAAASASLFNMQREEKKKKKKQQQQQERGGGSSATSTRPGTAMTNDSTISSSSVTDRDDENNNNNNNSTSSSSTTAAASGGGASLQLETEYLNPSKFEGTCCCLCRPRAAAIVADARGYLSVIPTRPTPRHGEYYLCRWRSHVASGGSSSSGGAGAASGNSSSSSSGGGGGGGAGGELRGATLSVATSLIYQEIEATTVEQEQEQETTPNLLRMNRKRKHKNTTTAITSTPHQLLLHVGDDQGNVSTYDMKATFCSGKIGLVESMFSIVPNSIPEPSHTDPPVIQDEFASRPKLLRHFSATEDSLPVTAMCLIESKNILVVSCRTKIRLVQPDTGETVGVVVQGRCANGFEDFTGRLYLKGEPPREIEGEEEDEEEEEEEEVEEEEEEEEEEHQEGKKEKERKQKEQETGDDDDDETKKKEKKNKKKKGLPDFSASSPLGDSPTSTSSFSTAAGSFSSTSPTSRPTSGSALFKSASSSSRFLSSFSNALSKSTAAATPSTKEFLVKKEFEEMLSSNSSNGAALTFVSIPRPTWESNINKFKQISSSAGCDGCGEIDLRLAKSAEAAAASLGNNSRTQGGRTPKNSPTRTSQFHKNTHRVTLSSHRDSTGAGCTRKEKKRLQAGISDLATLNKLKKQAEREFNRVGGREGEGERDDNDFDEGEEEEEEYYNDDEEDDDEDEHDFFSSSGKRQSSSSFIPALLNSENTLAKVASHHQQQQNDDENNVNKSDSFFAVSSNSFTDSSFNKNNENKDDESGMRKRRKSKSSSSPSHSPSSVSRSLLSSSMKRRQSKSLMSPTSSSLLQNAAASSSASSGKEVLSVDASLSNFEMNSGGTGGEKVELEEHVAAMMKKVSDALHSELRRDKVLEYGLSDMKDQIKKEKFLLMSASSPSSLSASFAAAAAGGGGITTPSASSTLGRRGNNNNNNNNNMTTAASGGGGNSPSCFSNFELSPAIAGNGGSSSSSGSVIKTPTALRQKPQEEEEKEENSLTPPSPAESNLISPLSSPTLAPKLNSKSVETTPTSTTTPQQKDTLLPTPVSLSQTNNNNNQQHPPLSPASTSTSQLGRNHPYAAAAATSFRIQNQQQNQQQSQSQSSFSAPIPTSTHVVVFRRPLLYPFAEAREATIQSVVNGTSNYSSAGGWVDRLEATIAEGGLSNPQLPNKNVIAQIRKWNSNATKDARKWSIPLTSIIEIEGPLNLPHDHHYHRKRAADAGVHTSSGSSSSSSSSPSAPSPSPIHHHHPHSNKNQSPSENNNNSPTTAASLGIVSSQGGDQQKVTLEADRESYSGSSRSSSRSSSRMSFGSYSPSSSASSTRSRSGSSSVNSQQQEQKRACHCPPRDYSFRNSESGDTTSGSSISKRRKKLKRKRENKRNNNNKKRDEDDDDESKILTLEQRHHRERVGGGKPPTPFSSPASSASPSSSSYPRGSAISFNLLAQQQQQQQQQNYNEKPKDFNNMTQSAKYAASKPKPENFGDAEWELYCGLANEIEKVEKEHSENRERKHQAALAKSVSSAFFLQDRQEHKQEEQEQMEMVEKYRHVSLQLVPSSSSQTRAEGEGDFENNTSGGHLSAAGSAFSLARRNQRKQHPSTPQPALNRRRDDDNNNNSYPLVSSSSLGETLTKRSLSQIEKRRAGILKLKRGRQQHSEQEGHYEQEEEEVELVEKRAKHQKQMQQKEERRDIQRPPHQKLLLGEQIRQLQVEREELDKADDELSTNLSDVFCFEDLSSSKVAVAESASTRKVNQTSDDRMKKKLTTATTKTTTTAGVAATAITNNQLRVSTSHQRSQRLSQLIKLDEEKRHDLLVAANLQANKNPLRNFRSSLGKSEPPAGNPSAPRELFTLPPSIENETKQHFTGWSQAHPNSNQQQQQQQQQQQTRRKKEHGEK